MFDSNQIHSIRDFCGLWKDSFELVEKMIKIVFLVFLYIQGNHALPWVSIEFNFEIKSLYE